MGRILAVASQKGGVGKTTTALNVGFSLSRLVGEVLLVDVDPQGGLTVASNVRKKAQLGLVQVLKGECTASDASVRARDGGLSVMGTGATSPADAVLLEEAARDGRLVALLAGLSETYAYVLLDAPSGIGHLPMALLACANMVLLPIVLRGLALKTLPLMFRTVQAVRRERNPRLWLAGALVNMFDSADRRDQEALAELTRTFPADAFFDTRIPTDPLFEEAVLHCVPVAMLPAGRHLARHYFELALEIREREQLREASDVVVAGLF